jgi:Coenzyme PQQ synthesis protein D (PqqD)
MRAPGPLARTEGLLTEHVDGELLVYDLNGDVAVHLNRTARLVWQSCDGNHSVSELADIVATELGEPADEDVVLMALDTLSEHGLIVSGYEEREGEEIALSRRRFFRRVGLTGLSAPIAYTMIVPTAAAALSTGGGGGGGGSGFIHNPPIYNRAGGSGGSGSDDDNGDDDNNGSGDGSDNYP